MKSNSIQVIMRPMNVKHQVCRMQITADAKSHDLLLRWIKRNRSGWKKTIASYTVPRLIISSEYFKFMGYKDFVVFITTDKNHSGGNAQYVKGVDSRQLQAYSEWINEIETLCRSLGNE